MLSLMKRGVVAAIACALAGGALAQCYLTAGGEPVRSSYGEYWHTGYRAVEPAAAQPQRQPTPVTYSAEVRFGFDDDTLSGEARKALDALAQKLVALDVDKVVAVGHADGVGAPQYNKRLSARRVKAVGDYLAGKGIAVERLQLVAMGERDPVTAGVCELVGVADPSNPKLISCLEPDRRVEIQLVGRERADGR
jgi:OOP family OmpA-OmpF porin